MLRYLNIRNLAVIEEIEIEFGPGFTVLTGETGAGKSILVEAVALLLGGRASSDLVRTGEEIAHIQALFETEAGRELVVRREITAQGRSRAFIDSALATATALRELSAELIELHGQHEHQILLATDSHLDLLDDYADLGALRDSVALAFERFIAARLSRDALHLDERQKAARIDLLTFQRDEIGRAALRPFEESELEAERGVLANAEKLQRISGEAYAALYDSEGAVLESLSLVWRRIAELAAVDARLTPYLEARESVKSQLEDLAFFLRRYVESIESSPERLQAVEDRLELIARLKRKYGETIEDVVVHGQRTEAELGELAELDVRAAAADHAFDDARREFRGAAERLSAARRAAAPGLANDLETSLSELAMRAARFEVRFNTETLAEAEWSGRGLDRSEFFVSANPGEDPRPLARIASGGELSRIMLALRELTAGRRGSRTVVFDEVDAGIGGRAADDVGRRLQRLALGAQVLCITHLPQIAVYADTQVRVTKTVRQGRTTTDIHRLDERGREEELARMMAGGAVTAAVLSSAAELLASRRQQAKGETKPKAKAKVRR